ncbi:MULTISPECIES: very short patch repair endonuclease [Rhodococcus]|uniref:very short patch repair endonuclease n=1 Tax=Rhodococcus TaxID=1827 RepID=UPI002952D3AC|nr:MULTISPECIES: very short patch repair endonuclease [Rhodococcus]MDV7244457.1 very short patch repair endonuclease [Rhodococcus oxybenzonivorans]MDV7274300.1 very short patch repair endonuclease [Rhodococcus oxybenzonivorans]MDV7337814.1 very short patch repair endonuclease [Rhodococcus oxybenzonivorans]MDV7345250.1 very short patch repair endonuclease [Rhodococcus oxybenzonivorans]MDV8028938.1 very short patch repair endonuclease [Rhodococcus sp. IEGM 27]
MAYQRGRPSSAARNPQCDTEGASWASTPAVRRRMQRQRTRDTSPEIAIRKLVHAAGLRYRVDVSPLPNLRRRADVVFRPTRVAIFIDGCFWHGCPIHGVRPTKSNRQYWKEKIVRNQARDRDTDERLAKEGWIVIRVWEHEDPLLVAQRILRTVADRRKDDQRLQSK